MSLPLSSTNRTSQSYGRTCSRSEAMSAWVSVSVRLLSLTPATPRAQPYSAGEMSGVEKYGAGL